MNIKKLALLAISIIVATQAFGQSKSSAFQLVDSKTTTLTPIAALAPTMGLKASRDLKSIDLTNTSVSVAVRTGPDADMLSFWIGGLRNPTLILKRGETIHLVFANTDGDMFHDMRFGGIKPPYSLTPNTSGTVGSDQLAHQTRTSVNAESITIQAPTKPGTYYYFCSVKGHAKGGMFGKVLVK